MNNDNDITANDIMKIVTEELNAPVITKGPVRLRIDLEIDGLLTGEAPMMHEVQTLVQHLWIPKLKNIRVLASQYHINYIDVEEK